MLLDQSQSAEKQNHGLLSYSSLEWDMLIDKLYYLSSVETGLRFHSSCRNSRCHDTCHKTKDYQPGEDNDNSKKSPYN